MNNRSTHRAFTLLEVLIAVATVVIFLVVVVTFYSSSQGFYTSITNKAEIDQNGRVALDRMAREIRQAKQIVTILPATDSDPGNPPPSSLYFWDGHEDTIQYIRYDLSGTNLIREVHVYYFASDPNTYVSKDEKDINNNAPTEAILSTSAFAEFVDELQFFGTDIITIRLSLRKNDQDVPFESKVKPRNL